jgi:hypothetical protein
MNWREARRRQKQKQQGQQAVEILGSRIADQASGYQRLLAGAPDVRLVLETLGEAADQRDLESRLLQLAGFESRIPHSHYRMDWVPRGWRASAFLLARATGLSFDEADKELEDLRSRLCREEGTSPVKVLLHGMPAASAALTVLALGKALCEHAGEARPLGG